MQPLILTPYCVNVVAVIALATKRWNQRRVNVQHPIREIVRYVEQLNVTGHSDVIDRRRSAGIENRGAEFTLRLEVGTLHNFDRNDLFLGRIADHERTTNWKRRV